jgi:hypothetical protein
MDRSKTAQLGLYAILLNGDYSTLKFNKSLLAFRYRIDIVPLDEFERKYGGVFLPDITGIAEQDVPVHFIDSKKKPRTVCISRSFEHSIRERFPDYIALLERGYVVLLKTYKTLRTDDKGWNDPVKIREYLVDASEFCRNFRTCLQLTIGDHFSLGDFFGCMVGSVRVVRYKEAGLPAPRHPYIELANSIYVSSLSVDNEKLRFIQLLHCLESCLNISVPDPASHITARHAAALVAKDKESFRERYVELVELYKIRNELIYEDLSGTVGARLEGLDKLVRDILKRLILLNYGKKEQLIEELELLTFQDGQAMRI